MSEKSLGADAAAVVTAGSIDAIQRPHAVTVTELGCAGHLIVSSSCRWRRHTQIGTKYRVSTVGDYYYKDKREHIGAGPYFFETMVFETTDRPEDGSEGCGCLAVKSYSETDGTRYKTAGEAQAGHERFVRDYIAKAEGRS